MAIAYPDSQISSNHIRYITRAVIPGFLLGFVSFGKIEIHKIHKFPTPSKSIRSILLNSPLIASLLFCMMVIFLILSVFWSIRRTDIFLIHNIAKLDEQYYQMFGTYMLLTFIVSIMILYFYLRQKRNYYIMFCLVIFCLGFLVSIILLLAGSVKELVALVLILFMSVIYAKPDYFIFRHNRIRIKNLFIVLLVLLLCGSACFYMSDIELPMLRIFGFQGEASLLENPSLISRVEILQGVGIKQLSINPVFGNLGAEYIVGRPGEYIHSLISVQSHLGIIGSFLLFAYLLHRLYRLYANSCRFVLKMITPPILFISFIGTFFTWVVFWFLAGALFAPRKDI